jgi:hypothetical protein
VHELRRNDATLVYLMFPIDRLKALAREAIKSGKCRSNVGDDGRFATSSKSVIWLRTPACVPVLRSACMNLKSQCWQFGRASPTAQ